jgi:4-hydroxythreonine-4-phosphate dehydrogenase
VSSSPLVVTAGEPAGIGPDLCIAIALREDMPEFVVLGDAALLRERARILGANIRVTSVRLDSIGERTANDRELLVLDLPFPLAVDCGSPRVENTTTLLKGLEVAFAECLAGRFSALVTAPIAKHVISDSGVAFTGHTEFLAGLGGTVLPVMLLVAGDMRVALATTHLPLRDVPDHISQELLRAVLAVLHDDLQRRFEIASPEIIVCGLNPHAGEGGHLGHEDAEIIAPVVAALQDDGINVRGPVPADTAFTPAAGARDAVLAMYHDQGLPVIKHVGFGHAVNVTLGLPIIRTSVDHGTAFDLAGSGNADAGSLVAAVELAASLAARK